MCFRALLLLLSLTALMHAQVPLEPVTVCELLADLPAHEGKDVAVLGRYSFRKDGRWIGEESCPAATASLPVLWLTEDAEGAPKPPGTFELDATTINRKFPEMTKRTKLGKFRFGTPDYDRWAVVYGRITLRHGEAAAKAPADLVFRGSGVVVFLTTEH
jgi:hypothetical protein